ncbi:hypothetical protein FRC03_008686 [Tulasnella sp. 419]|nr:hypothetical protein FRC02_000171 [Tulasnella sp. 418]KAG8958938.1 hypothetical protein FRC03_008686 [Tulasnella sp. 419]
MASPKRATSPSGGDGKRIRLTVGGSGPQNATAVDLDNAPGKRSEAEPIPGGDIANIPNYGSEAADVSMEGGEEDEEAEDESAAQAQADAHRLQMEEEARKYLAAQTHEVIIPSYATWFDMSSVHQVEKRALPEFFNSRNRSKTPSIYKEYRDFMINTYRLRPTEYLTFTACRRNLAGDVCAIMRVHAFLEQWGLINYQVDPDSRPAAVGPPFTGHFRITVDTPRGLQPLHPGTSRQGLPPTNTPLKQSTPVSASLELRKSIYQTTMKASKQITPAEAASLTSQAQAASGSKAGNVTYACNTCGVDCTNLRYHSLKVKDFELCPTCYLDGRFSSKMFSGDFVKLTATDAFKHSNGVVGGPDGEDDWTDEEKLLLLQGIELYDDDWYQVAEHVRTRSKEQCIAQFVSMPIEDGYLNPPREGDLGALQYARIPFDQTDNPVMSVVAFLAGAVGPGIAAAAAQGALGELTDGLRKKAKRKPDNSTETAESAKEEVMNDSGESDKVPDQEKEVKHSNSDADPSSPAVAHSGMDVDGGTSGPMKDTSSKPGIPRNAVERAAAIALGAASYKASLLAQHESNQMRELTTQIIKATLKKLEIKMNHFEKLEDVIEEERRSLEVTRQAVISERMGVKKALDNVYDLMGKMQTHVQDPMNSNMNLQAVQGTVSGIMTDAGLLGSVPTPVQMNGTNGDGNMWMDGQGPFGADDGAAIATLS